MLLLAMQMFSRGRRKQIPILYVFVTSFVLSQASFKESTEEAQLIADQLNGSKVRVMKLI